jgi:hypothetical protein
MRWVCERKGNASGREGCDGRTQESWYTVKTWGPGMDGTWMLKAKHGLKR